MANKNTKTIGMRRLFTKIYKTTKAKSRTSNATFAPSGKIIINSQYLKGFIGKKVRVIIYVQTSHLKK